MMEQKKRKVLIYDEDKMRRAGQLLSMIKISGVDNVRALAELSYILDSGEPGEMSEKENKDVGKDRSGHS